MASRHVTLVLAGFVVLGGCSSQIFSTALADAGAVVDGEAPDAAPDTDSSAADGPKLNVDASNGEDNAALAKTPDLQLWLRADDLSASPVVSWPDNSSKARHAAPLALAAQCTPPTFHISPNSGRPAVVFDGTACLSLTSGVDDFESGVSIFVVAETHPQDATTGVAPFLRMSGAGSSLTMQFGRDSTETLKYVTSNAGGSTDNFGRPGMIDGSWHLYEMIQAPGEEDTPSTVTLFIDGVPLGTDTVNVPADAVRAFNTIGGRAGGPYLTADIGEIILSSRAVNEVQRRLIEAALTRKWKL